MQTQIFFVVIGLIAGWLIPLAYSKIIEFKCKQKSREIPNTNKSISYKILVVIITALLFYILSLSDVSLIIKILASIIVVIAIVITMVDNTIRLIPNEILLPLLIIGFVFRFSLSGLAGIGSSLIAGAMMILFFGLSAKIAGFNKVGAGDIKLGFVIGVICASHLVQALLVMAITMGGFSAIGMLIGRLKRTDMIPFGGFMMAGLVTGLIYSINIDLLGLVTTLLGI